MEPVSRTQFALYRVIFGAYMIVHFLRILPDSSELFSSDGMIKTVQNLPSYGKLPIFLFVYDGSLIVNSFIVSLVIASISLTLGYYQRISSSWLFYGWISLFNRNPFISNPSMAYIGLILLSFICLPPQSSKDTKWKFPNTIYYGMWIIMPLSYTVSGLHKLQCPSWIDGSALHHVLTSLLARDNIIVKSMLAMPKEFLQIMTWVSLFAEISFLFLGAFKRLRKFYWIFFLFFHAGILTTVNFGDLTFGMLVSHLYLFDGRWFKKGIVREVIQMVTNEEPKPEQINEKDDTPDMGKWIAHALVASIIVVWIAVYVNSHEEILLKLNNLTMSSLWGFGYIVIGLVSLMMLERLFPDQKLKESPGWWKWVIGINIFQLFAVILATFTWEKWLQETSYFTSTTGFHLRDHVSPFVGGLIAYFINQWLFYWWHFMRHEVYILWILCHQFHHSARRIEAVTSFYKHPLEIVLDSQIMAALLYSVLGLTNESSIWLSIFSAFGEYFYHMNIKTWKFIGYVFQRPEAHRIHHWLNRRLGGKNFSDFVLFDILNDTYDNPDEMNDLTGFSGNREAKRCDMLLFRDVLRKFESKNTLRSALYHVLIVWGLVSSVAFLVHSPLAQKTSVLVSSPLPLVFTSFKGIETFSTTFEIHAEMDNGGMINKTLDLAMYSNLKGSYNRRNVYGVMFAYGPFFDNPQLISLRQDILYYGICEPGMVKVEFGIRERIKELQVVVKSKTEGNDGEWNLAVKCH